MIRERRGHWHYRFNLNCRTYSGNTGLEATERNRKAAMRAENTKRMNAKVALAQSGPMARPVACYDPRLLEAAVHAIRAAALSENFVYFIGSVNSVKIGVSRNVRNRLSSLQTASPEPLELLAVVPGDNGTEHRLHSLFAGYRRSGEWFRLEGPVKGLVDTLASRNREE